LDPVNVKAFEMSKERPMTAFSKEKSILVEESNLADVVKGILPAWLFRRLVSLSHYLMLFFWSLPFSFRGLNAHKVETENFQCVPCHTVSVFALDNSP